MPINDPISLLNIGLYLYAVLVTLTLLVGAIADIFPNRLYMKLFIALLANNIVALLGETGLWFFGGDIKNLALLKLSAFLAFGGGSLLIVFYSYCLLAFIRESCPRVKWIPAHINAAICVVYIALVVVSLFNGMFFDFDAEGYYINGKCYWVVQLLDFVSMLICVGMVFYYRKALTFRGTLALLSFSVLLLASVPLELIFGATPLSLMTTLSLIIMFILFHGDVTKRLAAAEVELAEKERRLTEQHISTMISQIQPHFIYNTLGSIHQLCLEQPEQAAELTQNFSLYLRGNFSKLDNNKPIRLSTELEHVRCYVNIEKVRFPDITVNFDVHCDDFFLPALSIQPLVENAIKHGLMGLESGGTVTITAFETETDYCVCVKDDGIGFDTAVIPDDKTHIGLKNIRGRLSAICGGTLVVESTPDVGTTATVTIPKEEKQ